MAEQALFQPFNRNQQRENLESTKETGLLISLIPSLQEDFYVDSLTTGASKETLSKLLLRNPGIKNETAVIEMIHFLHDEGDRISFSILLPFLVAEYDPKELEEKIRERFFGIELFIHRAKNLYHFLEYVDKKNIVSIEKEDLKRGILAWDMGELISWARIACETGYIDEKTAWEYIKYAGEQCRQTFRNWNEIGKSYLIGQAMITDKKEEADRAIRYFLLATQDENSPWRKNHFSLSTT